MNRVIRKPYRHVDLRGADLTGVYIGVNGRAAMVEEARARRLTQSAITPVTLRYGSGHVFLHGTYSTPGVHNTVTMSHTDPNRPGVEVKLSGGSAQYRRVTPIGDLAKVLDAVAADYAPTSRMGLFTEALTEGIRAWVTTGAAKHRYRFGHLDVDALQEAAVAPLRPLFDMRHNPTTIAELDAANLLLFEPSLAAVPADTTAVAVGLLTLVIELTEARYAARPAIPVRQLDEALAAAYGGRLWQVARPDLGEYVTAGELDLEIAVERADRMRTAYRAAAA